jgi:hypothetical protein
MSNQYYFDNTNLLTRYYTIWYGFINYKTINPIILDESLVNDVLTEVCDINFYIHFHENNIYLSIDSDSEYYITKFEKDIKPAIKALEDTFQIKFESAEFNANEYNPHGKRYKYRIFREGEKLILKKTCLTKSS